MCFDRVTRYANQTGPLPVLVAPLVSVQHARNLAVLVMLDFQNMTLGTHLEIAGRFAFRYFRVQR